MNRDLLMPLALLSFAGCTQSSDKIHLTLELPKRAPARGALELEQVFGITAPSTVKLFDCYAVNVNGNGIPFQDWSTTGAAGSLVASTGDSYTPASTCTSFPAASSTLVTLDSTSAELDVNTGPSRAVSMVGVAMPSGTACPVGQNLIDIANQLTDSTMAAFFNLGTTTADLYADQTIRIQNSYDSAKPVAAFCGLPPQTGGSSCTASVASGLLDSSFSPGAFSGGSQVTAMVVQTDGKIIVAGSFSTIGSTTVPKLARLNTDGSVDTTFNPGTGPGIDAINALALQKDGKILVGGSFTGWNSDGFSAGIVRLNADGSRDTSFVTDDTTGTILTIGVRSDGIIVLGGSFTTFKSDSTLAAGRIVWVDPNGSMNTSLAAFKMGCDNTVTSLVVNSDDSVVLSGAFSQCFSFGKVRIAKYMPNANLDTSFTVSAPNTGMSLALQADGKILGVAQTLTTVGATSTPRHYVRLLSTGAVDHSFALSSIPATAHPIGSVVQSDGKIVLVGIAGASDPGIFRLDSAGALDATFNSGGTGLTSGDTFVTASIGSCPGAIYAGGSKGHYNGASVQPLMRLGQ